MRPEQGSAMQIEMWRRRTPEERLFAYLESPLRPLD